jgi:hypothetical protein
MLGVSKWIAKLPVFATRLGAYGIHRNDSRLLVSFSKSTKQANFNHLVPEESMMAETMENPAVRTEPQWAEIPSLFSELSETLEVGAPFMNRKPIPKDLDAANSSSSSFSKKSKLEIIQEQNETNSSEEFANYVAYSREYSTLIWKQTLDPSASEALVKLLQGDDTLKYPQLASLIEILELVKTDKQLTDLTPAKVVALIGRKVLMSLRKPDIKKKMTSVTGGRQTTDLPEISLGRALYILKKSEITIPVETFSSFMKSFSQVANPDIYSVYMLVKYSNSRQIDWEKLWISNFSESLIFLLMCRRILSEMIKDKFLLRGQRKQRIVEEAMKMNNALKRIITDLYNSSSASSGHSRAANSLSSAQSIQVSDLLLSIILGFASLNITNEEFKWVKTCGFLDADKLSTKLILRIYASSVSLPIGEEMNFDIDEDEIEGNQTLLSSFVIGENKLRDAEYTAKLLKKGLQGNWDFEEKLELLALSARGQITPIEMAFKIPSVPEILESIKHDLQSFYLRIDQLHKIVNSCWKVLEVRKITIQKFIDELHFHHQNEYLYNKVRVVPKHVETKKQIISAMGDCFRNMGRSLSRLIGEGQINIATAYRILFLLHTTDEVNTRTVNQLQFAFADGIAKGNLSYREKRNLKTVNKYYYATKTGSRKLKEILNMVSDNQDQTSITKSVQKFLKTKSAMMKSENQNQK